MKNKLTKLCSVKDVNNDRGVITFVLTERQVDRDSEVIEPKGVNLGNFKNNPVFLWAHNTSVPPIGRVVPESIKISKDRITGDVEFDLDDPFAELIYNKYKKKHLNAGSIRFIPIAYDKEPVLPGQKGLTYIKSELLEFSAVPVPANAGALVQDVKELCDLADNCSKSSTDSQKVQSIMDLIEELKSFSDDEAYEKSAYGWLKYVNRDDTDTETLSPEEELQDEPQDEPTPTHPIVKTLSELHDKIVKVYCVEGEEIQLYPIPSLDQGIKFFDDYDFTKWEDVAEAMDVLLNMEEDSTPKHIRTYIYNELVKFYEQFGKEPPEFTKVKEFVKPEFHEEPINNQTFIEQIIVETVKQLNESKE